MSSLTQLGSDHEGATALEYALMAAAVAAVIVVIVLALGVKVNGLFDSLDSRWTAP